MSELKNSKKKINNLIMNLEELAMQEQTNPKLVSGS